MSDATVGQTKQFGKGQRTVPHPAQKAQKWYPVDDESQPKKVSITREIYTGTRNGFRHMLRGRMNAQIVSNLVNIAHVSENRHFNESASNW